MQGLAPIDLEVAAGERVGLIGANGVGKSTLFKLLAGLLLPSTGQLKVFGQAPQDDRAGHLRRIGALFGHRGALWPELTARQGLFTLGALHGLSKAATAERVGALAEALECAALLDAPVRSLSLGQAMRCELLAVLLHGPPLLLLDEPTLGLDAALRRSLRGTLRALAPGVTLLLASHDLADLLAIVDRVLVLDRAGLRYDGPVDGLVAMLGGHRLLRVLADGPVDAAAMGARPWGTVGLEVKVQGAVGPSLERLRAGIIEQGRVIVDLSVVEPDLEALLAVLEPR